ncbi:MAG: gliding motility-associated C-terminal domain-containing protein [Bacteroidales bacterium]|nr:gliding motility-associated C-terminal domain-containing protein [Bacteroidales bacterium]
MKRKDIGELYREAFQAYAPPPPAGGWTGVARQLGQSRSAGYLTWVKAFLGASAGIGIGYLVFSVWPVNDPPTPEPTSAVIAYEAPGQKGDTAFVGPSEEPAAIPERNVDVSKKSASPDAGTARLEQVQKPEPSTNANANKPEPVETIPSEKIDKQTVKEKSVPAQDKPSAMDRHRLQRGGAGSSAAAPVTYSKAQTICKGEKIRIGASGGIEYQWSNGSNLDSIMVEPELTSVYRVTVTRTDKRKVSGEVRVNVHDCSSLFVPNAFTPNGDGNNDEFIVYGTGIQAFRMVIQSVSGTVLYETDDISMGWDGTYLGQAAETGTYLYRVDYVDELGNTHSRNGRLTLLR